MLVSKQPLELFATSFLETKFHLLINTLIKVLLNCLMYKMCYYRFGQVYTEASEWFLATLMSIVRTELVANTEVFHMPGTVLSALYPLTHLIRTRTRKV